MNWWPRFVELDHENLRKTVKFQKFLFKENANRERSHRLINYYSQWSIIQKLQGILKFLIECQTSGIMDVLSQLVDKF